MTQNVVIVDYGLGNLFNLKRAFESQGQSVPLATDPKFILAADKLVLPGVGAFAAGMKGLEANGLIEAVASFAKTGKPLLGICLGMQLLMDESEENGLWQGLKLIPGRVKKFSPKDQSIKIPQICWNQLEAPAGKIAETFWRGTILDGLPDKSPMYFVNSYFVEPTDSKHTLAQTVYGGETFTSVVQKDNIVGCQFHPERSSTVGLKILKNFISK